LLWWWWWWLLLRVLFPVAAGGGWVVGTSVCSATVATTAPVAAVAVVKHIFFSKEAKSLRGKRLVDGFSSKTFSSLGFDAPGDEAGPAATGASRSS